MKHPDAVYSREETSPDGTLYVCYNYTGGEKTPTVIEPCVTVAASGEVLFDFWRTDLNGSLDQFTPHGFRLTASDKYGRIEIVVQVDRLARTFTLSAEPGLPQPLSKLGETLIWKALAARKADQAAPKSPAQNGPGTSIVSRLARWFGP